MHRNVWRTTPLAALALALGALSQPAWAITIDRCRTLTQSGVYQLTKNLTTTGGCFIIKASNVTLDLGGHTVKGDYIIKGDPSKGRDGVTAVQPSALPLSGITVRNGTITHFHTGVALGGTTGTVVHHLRVEQNYYGIAGGIGALIHQNQVHDNAFGGFRRMWVPTLRIIPSRAGGLAS